MERTLPPSRATSSTDGSRGGGGSASMPREQQENSDQPAVARVTSTPHRTTSKLRGGLGGLLLPKGAAAATDLTALSTLLSGDLCGKDCPMAGRTIRAPRTSSPDSSQWSSVPMWPLEAPVTYQNALAGLYSLGLCADRIPIDDQNRNTVSSQPQDAVRVGEERSLQRKLLEGSTAAYKEASRSLRKVQKLLQPVREVVVCTVTGAGTRLRDGALQLTCNTAVVLDGSCRDVHFSNLTFSGGVIVCHGANCSVNFTDVTFNRSTVVAVAGAQVTLSQATFKRSRSGGNGIAVYAHGAGTSVVWRGGSITGGTQGATVQAGASLQAEDLTITHTSVAGLEATGEHSSLVVSNCQISKFAPHHMQPRGKALQVVRGVRVLTGATADLSACCVAGAQWGIDIYSAYKPPCAPPAESPTAADNGGNLSSFSCSSSNAASAGTSNNSNLLDAALEGVLAEEHAVVVTTAMLRDCAATRCARQGIRVEGSLTYTSATGCDFSWNEKGGVVVMNGAKFAAEDCKTSDNKDAGYRASGTDTKVELTNCSTSGDLRGCEASSKGSMHATTVAVTGSIQEGFAVFSHAELDGCTVKDCGLQGLLVSGISSNAVAKDCVFRRNGKSGALARMCGTFAVTSCSSCRNTGPAYAVQGSISSAQLKACEGTGGAWGCMDRTGVLLVPCTLDVDGTEMEGFRTFEGSVITLRDCDRNCAKAFFDVRVKSDPSKSLPPDVTQIAINARGIFFHPQVPKHARCVYGICLNDVQTFSYATKKDQSFTIRARPRGYHAPLHLLQFETTRGRDISDLIIAITNKWLLM